MAGGLQINFWLVYTYKLSTIYRGNLDSINKILYLTVFQQGSQRLQLDSSSDLLQLTENVFFICFTQERPKFERKWNGAEHKVVTQIFKSVRAGEKIWFIQHVVYNNN